jgi:hypothetical protein
MGEAAPLLADRSLVLDRYRPLKPLGSGGSGSVWLARDERTGLDVALKIIAREGKAAARAEREAAAAARLRHPACLRAYDFARDDRHVYIAYEYVPGRTFREALRAGELRDGTAIEACAQVCDGLAHAHAAGILHRDVKPSNVLLEENGRTTARLLDFGLAQMAEAETLTAQGDVPGTLAYIAPERLAGRETTAAADVWAVGVMLWEALSGRHPFWQGSMLDTARAIEVGAAPLEELRPDLPKPLLRLVDRALELDPARRPSARELAQALREAAVATRRPPRQPVQLRLGLPQLKLPSRVHPEHAVAAGLAALYAGWTTAVLPFWPHGWPLLLAAVAGLTTLVRERLGLAVALAVPILPLGNTSSGLAFLYAALAAGWLLVAWRQPRTALLFALGPLLAPAAALALLPLATARIRLGIRRALVAAVGVLTAGVAAGLHHHALPLVGSVPPRAIGIGHSTGALDVAGSVARAAAAQRPLLLEALALALVAFALPHARARGYWGAAGLGAGMLLLTLLLAPGGAALPLVLSSWAVAACVALWPAPNPGSSKSG